MGNGSSRKAGGRNSNQSAAAIGNYQSACSACCCRENRTQMVVEKRMKPTAESSRLAEDNMWQLNYKQPKKPRTIGSKIKFGLNYFFCELCATICCPPCPNAIIHKLSFRPSERSTYDIALFGKNDFRIYLKPPAANFLRLQFRRCQAYTPQIRCFYAQRKYSSRIARLYARTFHASPEKNSLTLLYSHNNGIDLGLSVGYIIMLCRRYRVDVFAYDYAGYGRSTGQCSEANLYRSAEAAYEFLTTELAVPANEIVAMGTSLVTAAAIHLASTNRQLKGVILQGGFLSALRVVCLNRRRTCALDRFVNMDKVERVTVPTLVVHGKKDQLFSVDHAQTLRRLCPGARKIQPCLIDDCGHLDFDEYPTYWQRIHTFLHMDLTNANREGVCCTYHSTEVERRKTMKKVKGTAA